MQKEILIPDNANEIPMSRFQKYAQLDDEGLSDFYLVISALSGCTPEEAKLIKARDVQRAVTALIKALGSTDAGLIKKVKLNGVMYGFEPNLNEITIGMLADLSTQLDDPGSWHKVLAKLYRPIVREVDAMGGLYEIAPHVYPSAEYDERCKVFSEAPASLFVGARAFFLNGSMALSRFIEASLNRDSPKLSRRMRRELNRN